MVLKPNPSLSKIFIGRIVHSKSLTDLQILPHAALGIDHDGSISFILRDASAVLNDSVQKIFLEPSQFLFPSFVDTHLHAPQWPNLALGMDGTLREWIEGWTDPVEASYDNTEKAKRVYKEVVRTTLRLGSATVAYNSSFHTEATCILAKTAHEAGQRAIVGKMCVTQGSTRGNWEGSVEESLRGTEKVVEFVKGLGGGLVRASVQPRGGPYCPPELMRGLGELRSREGWEGVYVQGHMCETQDDIDRTLNLHPDAKSYSDMYLQNNLLDSKTIQAHCIHLQEEDIANLKSSQAGVAHCPNSNTTLRDGLCRIRDLLYQGIRVGLGTDCSAGYMPSIHAAMRDASNVSRHLAMQTGDERYILKFEELVWLATMGGAQVVDMADIIGNFEPGKKFDALIVDVRDVVGVDEALWARGSGEDEALVKKWVFLGDDRTIRKVFLEGRVVGGWDIAWRG